MTPRAILCSIVLLCLGARALPAQTARGAASAEAQTADSVLLRVDTLYKEGKQRESLELLKGRLGQTRGDYLAWVMAARAALALGYADPNPDSSRAWLHRSIAYGEGAEALDSLGENGRYVTLAATGRLALLSGPMESAHLGRDVEREALALLAIDSLHAGAHNALGRVYFEVARLGRIQRFIARAWLGRGLVKRATWAAAELHLRRAVELQPERNFHHLDLGALLFARGRLKEARSELQKALEVPLETPQQEGFRREARALLDKIDERIGPDSTQARGGAIP